MPSNQLVPPDTVIPDVSVGVDSPDTTRGVPPDAGVLKAITVLPTVIEYHVLLFHADA